MPKKRSYSVKKRRNYRRKMKRFARKPVKPRIQYDAPAKFTLNVIRNVNLRSIWSQM